MIRSVGFLCFTLVLFSLFLSACSHKEDKQQVILIGAAASLKPVMERLKEDYGKKREDISLVFTYASSGTIEQQIRQGAPIDVFISASDKQMQSLAEDQLLMADSITELMENQLVLIVPADGKRKLTGFDDITKASCIAIGDPESVPAGSYACEVFEYYGILNRVRSISIYGKDVTEVLAWVSSGNVEAGVVYATDAATTDKVTIVQYAPKGSHSKVVYPAAIVQGTKKKADAKDFITYLISEDAQEVIEEYGFIPLD